MSTFELNHVVAALGLALAHFLWQGVVIAALLELALGCLRNRSSDARYVVRCGALLLMAAAPVATFALTMRGSDAPAALPTVAADAGLQSSWPLLVVCGWSIGASLLSVRLLRDYLHIRGLQRSPGDPLPDFWQRRFDSLADSLGVRVVARVVDTAALATPTVIGWLKPVVLMPARVLTGLSAEQVDALIAHELAHVRRHDFAVNLVQCAVEVLLFYHPAVWWVSQGIRNEREFCCDDVALRVTADPFVYARALTTLESWRSAEIQIAMSTVGGSLMQRIQRLIGRRPTPSSRGPLWAVAALVMISMLGATALAGASHEDEAERIATLRARIAEMQAKIDELRALADRVELGADAARVEREHALRERDMQLEERERYTRDTEHAKRRAAEVHAQHEHHVQKHRHAGAAHGLDVEKLQADLAQAFENVDLADIRIGDLGALRELSLAQALDNVEIGTLHEIDALENGLDVEKLQADLAQAFGNVDLANIRIGGLDALRELNLAQALDNVEIGTLHEIDAQEIRDQVAQALEWVRSADVQIAELDLEKLHAGAARALEQARVASHAARAESLEAESIREQVLRALGARRQADTQHVEHGESADAILGRVHELLQNHVRPHDEWVDTDRLKRHVHERLQQHGQNRAERDDAHELRLHLREVLQGRELERDRKRTEVETERRRVHEHEQNAREHELHLHSEADRVRKHVHEILEKHVLPHIEHVDPAHLKELIDQHAPHVERVDLEGLEERIRQAVREHRESQMGLRQLHERLMRSVHEEETQTAKTERRAAI